MSQPPQHPSTSPEIERYTRTVHNVALVALVACPTLALLPPRKLDIYTIGLMATMGYSANYLVREKSGRSIWQHATGNKSVPRPEMNVELQSAVGELQKQGRGQEYQTGWKAERLQEIKEDVAEGKGFGDMIMDQIWEVWNQGKVEDDDSEN